MVLEFARVLFERIEKVRLGVEDFGLPREDVIIEATFDACEF